MAIQVTRAGVALTVGIIVVAGLIIGGLFWVRQSGEQARNDEAAKIAQEQLEEESNKDVALNDGENKDENKDESKQEDDSNTEQSPGSIPAGGQSTTELPQTGPSDALPIVGAGLLAFASIAYYKSRRALFE